MKLMYKIWLDNNGKAFGRGPYQLLIGVKNTGSLSQAAKMMNMSYSHAHLLMKSLSANIGFPLLESQAGGKGGGGTVITKQAEKLLEDYNAFCKECDEVIAATFLRYFPGPENEIVKLNPHDSLSPIEVLSLGENEVITLVGAGGKTSIMYALAEILAKMNKKVVIATTTKIFAPSPNRIGRLIISDEKELMTALEESAKVSALTVIGTGIVNGKLACVTSEFIDKLARSGIADYIIVEGDGAARKPFKAPNDTEPVVPESTTLLLTIVGLDILGKTLTAENAHRPEELTRLTGIKEGEIIDEYTIAAVLADRKGGRKNLPPNTRWLPVINKVDDLSSMAQAEKIAGALAKLGIDDVIFSSVHENTLDMKKWQKN